MIKLRRITLARIGTALVVAWLAGMAVLLLAITGCATTDSGKQADGAIHADAVSTGIALAVNDAAREGNPLSPLGPVRYWISYQAEAERCGERRLVHKAISVTGWGVTANNLAVAASFSAAPFLAIPGAVFGWWLAERNECEPHLLPEHETILADWERAYEAGDAEALGAILDNDALLARYADLFEATDQLDAVYTRAETVRGGFVTAYEVTLHYPDRDKQLSGELAFRINDGVITKVDQ